MTMTIKISKKWLVIIFISLMLGIATIVLYSLFFKKVDINKLKESIVLINIYDSYGELYSSGSGIIAIENDILITNAHVIQDAVENELFKIEVITENNHSLEILGVLGYSKSNDYAILKIENQKLIKPLTVDDNIEEISESVYVVGSPLGIKNTVSNGIISNYDDIERRYQFTAPISPGSSGGALINSKGDLIGLVYASAENGQNINFAIPIDFIKNRYEKEKDNFAVPIVYADDLYRPIIENGDALDLLVKFDELGVLTNDIYSTDSNENLGDFENWLKDLNFKSYLTLENVVSKDNKNYLEIRIINSTNINNDVKNNFNDLIEEEWSTEIVDVSPPCENHCIVFQDKKIIRKPNCIETCETVYSTEKEPDYILRESGVSGNYLYYIEYHQDINDIDQIINELKNIGK